MNAFTRRLHPREWHLARIIGRLLNYKRLTAKAKTPEDRLLLALKREIYAHKKHIVFTELLIERYEKEVNKLNK